MGKASDLLQKAKGVVSDIRQYWLKPPRGRYMSYKEILSYAFGSMGGRLLVYIVTNMIITVGNTLIGNTIGIDPGALYIIYILSILASIPLTAVRAKMIDNTRSMKGKYRPYILTMGIPTVVLAAGFVWMPYEQMSLFAKCAVVLAFNVGFQFFYQFFNDAYTSIINVLSPNTIERSDVLSIKSIIENLSPSIVSILLPIVARWITGENTIYDLQVYRVLYPPLLIVAFLLSMLIYVNTEEKIVQAKTHVIQIKFMDALRAVAQNKYFWIISLAGWIGFLESSFNSILGWLYNYQGACTPAQYSLIVAITGNASFWPFLFAPLLIRKFGKKRLLVFSNLLNVFCIALMLPAIRMTGSAAIIWVMVFCFFINQFFTSMGNLLNPGIQGDLRDYQQYKTGERIDGMFASVALIGSVITLATSSVLPAIYEQAGLNQTVARSLGYDGSNVYDVLYNHEYFVQICSVLILASVAGATLNLIPYFFYDLTETKQRAMVCVLKIRALFEDYGNNVLSDELLVETVDIIRDAQAHDGLQAQKPQKADLRAARRTHDKEAVRAAKAAYKAQLETNEKIEIASYVMRELSRFQTPEGIADLALAKKLADAGLEGAIAGFTMTMADAKKLPKDTPTQKEHRKDMIRLVRTVKTSRNTIKKYYKDGITPFDASVFESLFAAEDKAEADLHAAIQQLKAAREAGDRAAEPALREQMRRVQAEKRAVQAKIKQATEENSLYYRAAKPYLDACKTVKQSENYTHYDEIMAMYDDAKARLEAKAAAETVQEAAHA